VIHNRSLQLQVRIRRQESLRTIETLYCVMQSTARKRCTTSCHPPVTTAGLLIIHSLRQLQRCGETLLIHQRIE
jgi:hypothetical protein